MIHDTLYFPPDNMAEYNLSIKTPMTLSPDKWAIVKIEQAYLELHHEVLLIDEHSRPIDAWTMFGFPGGNGNPLPFRVSSGQWRDYPNMRGNPQYTLNGYARHTFNAGGESIYVIDPDASGLIQMPSAVLSNCSWLSSAKEWVRFLHTGVRVTFQRQKHNVKSLSLETLAARISDLEDRLNSHIGSLVPLE